MKPHAHAETRRPPGAVTRRRDLLGWGLFGLAPGAIASAPAEAKPWPLRAIRLLVVYPPGGLSDEVARHIGRELAAQVGVPVFVENRDGAGGRVGIETLARTAPDGHTLAFSATSPISLMPHLMTTPYVPFQDVVPVAGVMRTPTLVVATAAFKGTDFHSMLSMARQAPGRIRWASSGVATVGHMVLEQVRAASGAAITHVPYKGGGRQIADALAGHFEILSTNAAPPQFEHIRQGRWRALAVGAPVRLEAIHEVPTLAELGFPRANLASHFGIFAPGPMAEPLLALINRQVQQVLGQAAFIARLAQSGNLPSVGNAQTFLEQVQSESRANLQLIRAVNLKAE